jgi:hypothetical protein
LGFFYNIFLTAPKYPQGPRQELETEYAIPRPADGNLGLTLAGGMGSGAGDAVTVQEVLPGGAVALDGRLRPGMTLLSIDTHSLVGVSHSRAVTVLSIAKLRRTQPFITVRPGIFFKKNPVCVT